MLTVEPSSGTSHSSNWYQHFIKNIEGAYFGVVAFTIAISGIFGGVALAFIFQRSGPLWQLFLSITLVLGNMIIPVAQQKLKPVVTLFLISIGVNSLIIIFYLVRDGFY